MRRAAISIPSNIAEGYARASTNEFIRFISIALGSVAELETHIILSVELGYLQENIKVNFLALLDIIGKTLRGLCKSLERRRNSK
jgi:four helix bundle protein